MNKNLLQEIQNINYLFGYKKGVVISEQTPVNTESNLSQEELQVLGYLNTVMDEYTNKKRDQKSPPSFEEIESDIKFNKPVVDLANQLINKRNGKGESVNPQYYNIFKNNMIELGNKGKVNIEDLEGKGKSVKSMSYNTTN
jgi:hypothetical protein